MVAHVTCLAQKLCEPVHLVPVCGFCPLCRKELFWGEMVRRLKASQIRIEIGDEEDDTCRKASQTKSLQQE